MRKPKNEKIIFDAYKCSGCSFVNTFYGRVKAHIEKGVKCKSATIQKLVARGEFVPLDIECTTGAKRGPKGIHAHMRLMDKIPWDDVTTRVEYLITDPELIKEIFVTGSRVSVVARMFHYLWGIRAPEKFQSVIQDMHCYWAREGGERVERIVAMSCFESKLREVALEGMLMFYDKYKETLPQEMQYIMDCVWGHYFQSRDCMTMADVLAKNTTYKRYKRQLSDEDRLYADASFDKFTWVLKQINPNRRDVH